MAYSALSGDGTSTADDQLLTAVWRLRSRACWADAAELLKENAAQDARTALHRAALLGEGFVNTGKGWEQAEGALRHAEALARSDEDRGAAACERGHLAYAATLLGVRDRADEARAALGRAAALLPPGARARALLDFRRGLMAENLADAPVAARAAYRRAHAVATSHGDEFLLSFTWCHLASLALREGEQAEARLGFTHALRIRERLGYLVGAAPALAALAHVEAEPEASRLRAEAVRLLNLLGGVPSWLAAELSPPAASA